MGGGSRRRRARAWGWGGGSREALHLHKRHVARVSAEEAGRPPPQRMRPVVLGHLQLRRPSRPKGAAHPQLVVDQKGE
eukprot:scaffold15857_cov56-Isochrysis_galbana.AAC.1